MLFGLLKSQEERLQERIEKRIRKGLQHLGNKFFNKAMIEFDKAMELDKKMVYPRLVKELDNVVNSGQTEAALAIGLNLLKVNHEDYKLANKLGNFAREIGDFRQASDLYKTALRVNKNYETAFYNLAATMAKVPIYDEAVKNTISIFDKYKGYIFPEYLGDPNILEYMSKEIPTKKAERLRSEIETLEVQQDDLTNRGEPSEVNEIRSQIKELKGSLGKVTPEDFVREFEAKISEDPTNKDHVYNLGLYCVSHNLPQKALDTFKKLSPKEYSRLELLQAIAYAELGKINGAIKIVTRLLGENEFNRYNNVNIGIMYKKLGKRFQATKYLIKTACLLDKSGGIYSMTELVNLAYEKYKEGNLKSALGYFEIASSENPEPDVWKMIGTIYIETKKYDDAVHAFKKMLELDPKADMANEKLREIHDYYCGMAVQLINENKYNPAASYYEKALSVLRVPETIKAAAEVHRILNNNARESELMKELFQLQEEQKNKATEAKRQKYITTGKKFLKAKNYAKATEALENAFRMKVDKSLFLQLSAIYKGLKKHDELYSLAARWKKMLEHEEKVKQFERAKEREKAGSD
jgi:tetratricopeptide (TPR) repeat protein